MTSFYTSDPALLIEIALRAAFSPANTTLAAISTHLKTPRVMKLHWPPIGV